MSTSDFLISATLPVVDPKDRANKVDREILESTIIGLTVFNGQVVIKGRLVPCVRLEVVSSMFVNQAASTTPLGELAIRIAKLISLPLEKIVFMKMPLAS